MYRIPLVLLLALSAHAQLSPTAQQMAAHLTADHLKADVSFLASDTLQGRGTPSPGLDVAAEFIASQFRRAGLEPVGDDGYFQTATFESAMPNTEGLELTLEMGESLVKADKASITLQEAVACDLNHTPVVKVMVKDAADLDALTVAQVKGNVLLIEFLESSPAVMAAARRVPAAAAKLEAALVVMVRGSGPMPMRGGSARLRDAAAATSKVPVLVVTDPAVRSAVASMKQATLSAHIAAPATTTVKLRNVVGLLQGSDPALKDTYVIVTGHYDHLGVRGSGPGDHIYNGANDDASGTSSVIEIAAALAEMPARPRRSILFMTLFGEEVGGLGSRYYCSHPIFPADHTVADINLEQLGRTDDTEGPTPRQFNLTGFDYTNIATILSAAGDEVGIKVVKHEKNSDAFFTRSDNASFAEIGIPDTTLSVSYVYPDYHQPGDEWQKLDYDNMAKVDVAIGVGLLKIANSAEPPHWNMDNPKAARYVKH